MKNPKILLIALGGITAVLALVFGWLIWSGISERGEVGESLEGAVNQADRLVRLPVRPCQAAIDAVNSNATAYVDWTNAVFAAISRGDRRFDSVTPPAFKTFLVNEARRLSSLPGSADGRLVKKDFAFGFKDYITGGVLPTVADLPRLQREWADVTTVVELLATNGVAEILDVRIAAAAPAEEESAKSKSKRKSKSKGAAKGESLKPDVTRFTVDFRARPEALVGVVNGAAALTRFVVVEDFSFASERDAIAEELGGEEKAAAAQASGGRRGRRRAAREEAAKAEKAKDEGEGLKTGAVTDPATVEPFKVTMTFAAYDFRTANRPAEATAGEGAK